MMIIVVMAAIAAGLCCDDTGRDHTDNDTMLITVVITVTALMAHA